jgi:hypothetical protein
VAQPRAYNELAAGYFSLSFGVHSNNMRIELSKRQRILVRELAAIAHEREMRALLSPFAEDVVEWRSGSKDTWALLEDLDRFDRARHRLSQRYQTQSIAPMLVAHALVAGIVRRDEVNEELVQVLKKPMEFYRQGLADGTIRFQEE